MNFVNNNNNIDGLYLGNSLLWSYIPEYIRPHISRVIADGGTIPEQSNLVTMINRVMTNNLWDNCLFFGLPFGGVKKNSEQYISKIYDLKGNADLSQLTTSNQPKYGVGGSISCDGSDLLNNPLNIFSQLVGDKELSLVCWFYWSGTSWIANYPAPIRMGNTAVTNVAAIDLYNGYPAFDIWGGRMIATTPLSVKTWYHCVAAKSPGVLSTSSVSIYINGKPIGIIKEGSYSQPNLTVGNIMIGANGDRYWLGSIATPAVYNIKLNQQQAKWLYNNTRPVGV